MWMKAETGIVCGLALTLGALIGCGGSSSSGTGSTGTGTTTPVGALAAGGATSVYVVQSPQTGSNSILQFAAAANGATTPAATLTAPTSFQVTAVALDAAGQIYVGGALAGQPEILAYAAGSTGPATPTRTILFGSSNPYNPVESLTVDSAGNLYVVGFSGTIAVYSATATGAATPTRTISGALTTLPNLYPYTLALDSTGNMYVAAGNNNGVGGAILVFGPTANGNVAPTRMITSSTLAFFGMAVDASGNIFTSEDDFSKGVAPAVLAEFSPTATGAATPTKTITLTGTTPSILAAMRMDAVGNLYAVLATQVGTGANATAAYSVVAVGPTATGTMAPAAQMTSTAWSSSGSSLAIK